jgi:hypothetical protein
MTRGFIVQRPNGECRFRRSQNHHLLSRGGTILSRLMIRVTESNGET